MDFEQIIKQFQDGDLDKDKFVEQAKDRISFLESESKKAFEKRGIQEAEPLLAHSFERVMPGRDYVSSIRDIWRVCSGINDKAREKVTQFLSDVLHVDKFPLTVLDRPIESETCKIIENSYRATILAFLDEWSVFAERNGVDLSKVIEAIKIRPTHSNIIFPGPGIGGYCLPKDGGLGVWAYHTLMGFEDEIFKITPLAIDINDTRGMRAAQLVRDALRNMGMIVAASKHAGNETGQRGPQHAKAVAAQQHDGGSQHRKDDAGDDRPAVESPARLAILAHAHKPDTDQRSHDAQRAQNQGKQNVSGPQRGVAGKERSA